MANIKSQIKRNRQAEARKLRNKSVKSALKTYVGKFRTLVESGDKEAAAEALRVAGKALDKAAANNVIHPNNAANKKSAMAKQLNSL